MEESSDNHIGFNSRAAALLNNQMFSDVEIQVKDGNINKTFLAHKLFLSMSSREFASMFYGKFESPKVIKIFDFKPHTVYQMLQYLYTDKCDLSSIEETKHLYNFAKKYQISEIQKYCLSFLTKEKISLDNLFDKYEFALSEKITSVLEHCRDMVSVDAQVILKSPEFANAQMSVVEDILQLDTLNVKSEMEVIYSAIEWARQECLRRGSYTESLRICLYPLFKYLRFLSLTAIEFCDFVEKNENILNSHESAMLTMSLIKPSSNARLPSGFTSNSSPRFLPQGTPLKNSVLQSQPSDIKNKFNLSPIDINLNNVVPAERTLENVFKSHLIGNNNLNKIEQVEKSDTLSKYVEPSPAKELLTASKREYYFDYKSSFEKQIMQPETKLINSPKEVKPANELDYEFKPVSSVKDVEYYNLANHSTGYKSEFNLIEKNNKHVMPAPMYKRADSVPVSSKKQYPVLKVSPQVMMNQRRSFEFPLRELGKSITSAFPSDIKCSATVHLHRGAIEIYGIELKIKEEANKNVIKAFLTVTSTDHSHDVCYDDDVKNGMFSMEFSEPLKLVQSSQVKIEVLVEEIVLNRCHGYFLDKCELNCGLNVNAEIVMKSNQFDEERGYFFLISRLLYRPC